MAWPWSCNSNEKFQPPVECKMAILFVNLVVNLLKITVDLCNKSNIVFQCIYVDLEDVYELKTKFDPYKSCAEFLWALSLENLSSGVCEQQRRRPACTSSQSDQRLCYSLIGKYHI